MSSEAAAAHPEARGPWRRRAGLGGLILLLALSLWATSDLGISLHDIVAGVDKAGIFVEEAWPPDGRVLKAEEGTACWPWFGLLCSRAGAAMVETVQIAFIATIVSLVLSLPLSLVAARTLAPVWSVVPVRTVLAAVRVMPSLLWAVLFVIIVGPGPFAGVAAMSLYSLGYLTKLQYETFEGLPQVPIEAARAMGLGPVTRARWVIIPESANSLLSQSLFMLDYNIRASTIIGVVGAGGIGRLIGDSLGFLLYDRVLTYLLVIFATVLVLEWISAAVRARFMEGDAHRARWGDALTGALLGGLTRWRSGD